jgi:hypothetical protein
MRWLEDNQGDDPEGEDLEFDPSAADSVDPPHAPRPLLPALPRWHGYDAATVMHGAYEEVPLLIPDLEIGQGRPTGLWGAPGAGKNDAVQAIALAVISGRPAFGRFPVGHRPNGGRVVHITYDLGLRATALRYRRLANGMGLTTADVPTDSLMLCAHPPMHLSTRDARKAFSELMQGYDLAILDNARGATPGVDENDSAFGALIALYGAAAESVGCVPLYLHHTRKLRDGETVSIDQGRGSSAIVGASGCVWMISGSGADPRRMTQVRQHDSSDGPKDPFTLARVERQGGAFDTGGRVSWKLEARAAIAGGSGWRDKVIRALTRQPMTETGLRKACSSHDDSKVSQASIREALASLTADGTVIESGGKYALS